MKKPRLLALANEHRCPPCARKTECELFHSVVIDVRSRSRRQSLCRPIQRSRQSWMQRRMQELRREPQGTELAFIIRRGGRLKELSGQRETPLH